MANRLSCPRSAGLRGRHQQLSAQLSRILRSCIRRYAFYKDEDDVTDFLGSLVLAHLKHLVGVHDSCPTHETIKEQDMFEFCLFACPKV